eukprot:TRINITY_DN20259_c0_g1_i2.p1 TRINITY_DN20259_c0_g1~~TRINITY_DN20259_c0_g1_i2.p1  ORF type:complete len:465 (+),score=84.29 TRINITY_DN20259_c0_g1_i2:93-1487(+)
MLRSLVGSEMCIRDRSTQSTGRFGDPAMNLQLLNPHETASCPEVMDTKPLEDGCAGTCAFNRRGTLIAVGCSDGHVMIWDFGTKGVVRRLKQHVRPVTSVCWSNHGRKLLSSSNDRTVKLWDIQSGQCELSVEFESAVMKAQMHPTNCSWCVVCVHSMPPLLVNLETGDKRALRPHAPPKDPPSKPKAGEACAAISFDKQGNRVFWGDDNGDVSVVRFPDLEPDTTFTVTKGQPIKGICFSRPGKHLLVICNTSIKLYDAATLEIERTFQDQVNQTKWRCCCFSNDAYYVIGGSATMAAHSISIWDRTYGHLERILEGPKEGILDLAWHPCMPVICSVSTLGVVYVWTKQYTENWSAFAPDFTELEENEEYIEAEHEFDIVDWGEKDEVKERNEDEHVDILTNEKLNIHSDSDDELAFLPAIPEKAPDAELKASGRIETKNNCTEKHNQNVFKKLQVKKSKLEA